jgi:GTPase SAR1 family protein
MPTVGADVYSTITTTRSTLSPPNTETGEVNEEGKNKRINAMDNDKNNTASRRRQISLQVWDTPGRERFVNPNGKTRYTASFSDNFLRNLDAVCLVYDVSSSTSFTHVLNWYYELIERIRRMKANQERTRHLPIVIVGNKIDIFQDRDTRQKELLDRKKEIVQQRNVLGLTGNWRGRDYRYEYSANAPALTSTPTKSSSSRKTTNNKIDGKTNDVGEEENRLELLTYLGTNTNYLEAILNNEVYRGSYLDSLLSSEDNSHPDKDMVQLWCMVSSFQFDMIVQRFSIFLTHSVAFSFVHTYATHFASTTFLQRNGLIHMDVSAKSGVGINDLINQLIDIALKQIDENVSAKATTTSKTSTGRDDLYYTILKRNDELDLHKRYAPKSRSCFPLPFQSCCK